MAASASQVTCEKYDVFISFRGSDTRSGFLSHLIKELHQKNIDVYVDYRLERGDEISSALMKAIEGSKIALVIFSEDYASSKWCLEELVKIMECKEAGQQIMMPVFYLVDPSDVRHQKRTYAEAFTTHDEEMFKDKVEIWRSVLKKSANLAGYDSSKFQDESNLIDAIVEGILKKLEDNSPIVPNFQLIGSHQNFPIVESLMEIKSQEVRIVGIWGMGGIGKTTLARAIFDKFLFKFDSYCFLKNVRENSTKVDGFNSLSDKLLSQLLGQKDHKYMNNALKRLQRKKVLIALDDVDNSKQLKDFLGLLRLGPGSRVIVTSRDKHVLRSGGIHDQFIHLVNELSLEESLELFSMHAFNQSHPKMGYQELSKMTVAIAKGIPLALEVLGSHFHSRDKAYWESELSKLKRYPHEQIQSILKISYDGLHPMDKEIFLDIAFFFVGDKKDIVTCRLEACGFKAVSGIQNLIDKALVTLDPDDCIVMHDLIREMAEQIVRGESMRHPERRSRLKDADEIYDVLKSNKGTDEIQGIMLDVTQIKYVQVEADIFVKMKNLRFLKFFSSTLWRSHSRTYIDLHYDLDSFSNKLRYLHWDHYPLETLPSGFYFENLVELHMQNSQVKRLWDGKQDLGNLKTINLMRSKQLIELPDLSMARKLESVYLQGCKSLRSVHASILSLPSIVKMEVSGCSKLESIESETRLESFSDLSANYCCLKKLCFSSNKLSHLFLQGTKVEILHFPVGGFTELTHIRISGGMVGSLSIDGLYCLKNLEVFEVTNLKQAIDIKQVHSLFDAWRNLRELRLEGWSYLSQIPDNIKALKRLKYLSLNESAVETLPASVYHISSLKYIYLRGCKRLKSILGLPPFLQKLDAFECTLLETVSSDSLVRNKCVFNFYKCEKLDERSLRYIQDLILSSMTSTSGCHYYDEITCYPGNRVPEWMVYKPMTKACNAIEFTCNLERSQDLLICCVAPPHLVSKQLLEVQCYFSYDDNNYKFRSLRTVYYPALNQDHVLLWPVRMRSYDAGIAKISCELFLEYWDDEEKAYCDVPTKACGAHLI
ncbi:hypothetical protein QN277_016097 [Acacia crassicarpa]|uniref:ADP-ribosyl cyclase/cyclic ADP-ribose hydrolase n=1 Tax=Acacia crassicarpa TaxID=499986 RepID=A0AAE1TAI9_9FABA|nr:hypothetical protein QN277_016097 [Acacia crassicarpa]